MKKILFGVAIVIVVFLIYLVNMDREVYYLVLGDSLSSDGGYADYVCDYLLDEGLLERCVMEFAEEGYRTTDLIKDISDNKKVVLDDEVTLQNALIKADLVTITIGANDILDKVSLGITDDIYDYIDELGSDLDELFGLMREYCKEDIVMIGYYNPYSSLEGSDEVIMYLNEVYGKVCDKYSIKYLEMDTLFKENPEFLVDDDIHPSSSGYEAIAGEVIGVINSSLIS